MAAVYHPLYGRAAPRPRVLDKPLWAPEDDSVMFGLGVPELLFIMVLALLVFGPKRLPHIGRTLGRGMAEFRRASTELQRSINIDLDEPARPPAAARVPKVEPGILAPSPSLESVPRGTPSPAPAPDESDGAPAEVAEGTAGSSADPGPRPT